MRGPSAPAFLAVFLGALILTTPMRLAYGWMDADRLGLSAQAVDGTVWNGRLRGAALRGLDLGEARAGLDPAAFLTGMGGLWIEADGQTQLRGRLRVAGARFGVRDLHGAAPIEALAPDFPFKGRLRLEGFSAQGGRDGCTSASGRASLETALGGPGGQRLRLTGAARCEAGRIVLPLSGAAQGASVDARLEAGADGGWRLVTLLRAGDPATALAAQAAGFERTLQGLRRTDAGRLRIGG